MESESNGGDNRRDELCCRDTEAALGTRSYLCKALAELTTAAASSCAKAEFEPGRAVSEALDSAVTDALAEDWELRAFAPLALAQQRMHFGDAPLQEVRPVHYCEAGFPLSPRF